MASVHSTLIKKNPSVIVDSNFICFKNLFSQDNNGENIFWQKLNKLKIFENCHIFFALKDWRKTVILTKIDNWDTRRSLQLCNRDIGGGYHFSVLALHSSGKKDSDV